MHSLTRLLSAASIRKPIATPAMFHLIFDFDGTITHADTINTLATSAVALQRSRTGRDLGPAWDAAVREYLAEYGAYKDSYVPEEQRRTCVAEEAHFLKSLKTVEDASLDRVSRSGIFAGLSGADLRRLGADAVAAGDFVVREGFGELLDLARQRGWKTDIISVNWSCAFISGVLGVTQRQHHDQPIRVIANEIDPLYGQITGPSFLGTRLTTSADKLRAMRHLLAGHGDDALHVVYFGDSTTDLECLLHARQGVVLSSNEDQSSLLQTLRRVDHPAAHVGTPPPRQESQANNSVSWARDFHEVLASHLFRDTDESR
ncbi:prohibitin-2 [Purpureocillium lavendulum]|uniref:Prohibitin-2 n=1 Tax=Purpureocillium lavendulum TaxID=1247861 RepID=A0AB34G3G8_9HYPO|nr:prohibitin-2 [Purpureocillium lavendulum]